MNFDHPSQSRPLLRPGLPARLFFLLAFLFTISVASPAARAQGEKNKLEGAYTYVADRSDSIDKAIDKAVSELNFLFQPIGRSRLQKTNQIYQHLNISMTGGQVSVANDGRKPIKGPPDGSSFKWTREDGEVLDVTLTLSGDTLRQRFTAKDGQRTNEYTVSPDGQTVTMKVTVKSPRLTEPLTYRLAYRRNS